MVTRIPTQLGDVLVLRTDQSFSVYVVGQVTKDGQQDFDTYCRGQPEHAHQRGHVTVTYTKDHTSAVAEAKALVVRGGRIFLRNLDTGDWSEILN